MAGTSFELLPTGKPHVSFSELREWSECSYRHKLHHVDKLGEDVPGPLMDFGTAVHSACEAFLRTRSMDPSIATSMIERVWEKNREIPGFEPSTVSQYVSEATNVLTDVPNWMDETFPSWQCIDAEHQLYEPIAGQPHAFKGFIDGIISCVGPRNKQALWLLDWKTTSWGWAAQKRSDPAVKSQLVLYKSFWSQKVAAQPKDVRCGFVLLKRSAKPGQHCELVTVSAGDVTTARSLKVVNNMLASVKKGLALKNRGSCTYCEFKDTKWCT